jgi:predicted AlkP superfamily phosphohydrolase/phosphomutase
MRQGVYGNLESCTPAITVPAWSVMTSSKDPGTLGIYGFRNRADHSYDKMSIATNSADKEDRVRDILSRSGNRVNVVGCRGLSASAEPPRRRFTPASRNTRIRRSSSRKSPHGWVNIRLT